MSASEERLAPMSSEPSKTPRRRWYLAAACLLLFAWGVTLPSLWEWSQVYPAWQMFVTHTSVVIAIASVIVALVWFFFLANLGWRLRLGALVLGVTLLAA